MNHVYDKARTLRLKGYSYNEINKKIGVAKSTLWSWFSDVKLPQKAINRLKSRVAQGTLNGLVKRNKNQTVLAKRRTKTIRIIAKKEIGDLSENDLRLVGISLYWAEGYKRLKKIKGREITSHVIGFTNSDPAMVFAFILFLKNILKISENRIFIETRFFKHMIAEEVIRFWIKTTKLPRSQFYKPMYPVSLSSLGKRPFDRLPYGTVRVIVSDTNAFYRLMGMIDGLQDKLKAFQ